MTTIDNYYEDGNVLLSEEQKHHFQSNFKAPNYNDMLKGNENSARHSQIIELDEEH